MIKPRFIIQHEDQYVGGFSFKRQLVWYTSHMDKAHSFRSADVHKFITAHANKAGTEFFTDRITLIKKVKTLDK